MDDHPPPTKTITLARGQAVAWRASPNGIAQIEELRRKRVRLVYRTKRGTYRRPVVDVARAVADQLLFDLHNPFNRADVSRSRTYRLDG
jgi:hypothetical protein